MAHRFDDKQKIDQQWNLAQATGPVETDEKMFWISAVVYQNGPEQGHYAAAWGETEWPTGVDKKWDCPMEMAQGSKPFKKGPAKAWALARVTDGGGKFFAWPHPVELE